MSSSPKVAVLVLNCNGQRHLSACLPGLEAQVYSNRDIVVVDNGSTDDSLAFVRRAHPSVRVLERGYNASAPIASWRRSSASRSVCTT